MLYEFLQVNAAGNGTSTISYVVQNPRLENGLTVVEVVGIVNGWDDNRECIYKACQPKKMIVGGNFTMVEYTRELTHDDAIGGKN